LIYNNIFCRRTSKMQPRKASCIVMLRQSKSRELEVLMAQRNQNMKAFPGAFIFPGGVVEACDGPENSEEQSKRCGLRELFDEAGVLLSKAMKGNSAEPVKFGSLTERLEWQKRVHDNPNEFERLLREKNVRLPLDSLFYWITFVTPVMEARRFDTDFFIVDTSYEEEGLHLDGNETVSLAWVSPSAAIERNAKGGMPFLPPQYFVLSTILKSGKSPSEIVQSVLKRQPSDRPVPILPHPIALDPKEVVFAYPGDQEHCDYPGKAGMRHQVHIKTPVGRVGFQVESTLPNYALTYREWEHIKSGSSL